MYGCILVATDGSPAGDRAVDRAIDLAERFDADLCALFVVDDRGRGKVANDPERHGGAELDEIAERAPVPVRTAFRRGRPRTVVGEWADAVDADLVVVGAEIGSRTATDGPQRLRTAVRRPVLSA